MTTIKPNNIDAYIAGFAKETQTALLQIRQTINSTVPQAEESISYNIPSFKLNGRYLIYFAAHTHHIGMYPMPETNETFEKLKGNYKTSGKGTIQFPLNEPMPLRLIKKIVLLLDKLHVEKLASKKNKIVK